MKRAILAFLLVAALLPLAAATRTGTVPAPRIFDMQWFDLNRWRCPIYNDGRFGVDVRYTNFPGGSWPYPLKNFYQFGGGLWVGCIKDTTLENGQKRTDTLVTFGYNPNSGGSEMVPSTAAHWTEGRGSSLDRIYKFPTYWPPPASRFPMAPTDAFSLQDFWIPFCDLDATMHSPNDTRPIGFEVYLTCYVWNYAANQDIIFFRYDVKNVSVDTLRQTYFGVVSDPDIGDAEDDMIGLILDRSFTIDGTTYNVKNVGFCYDNNQYETPHSKWEKGTPGVVAYKFLESPRGGDGDQLGMTSFKRFTIDIDPPRDPARYLTLAGYDYQSRVRNPYDSLDTAPGDKRFLMSSGPFSLPPDSVATILVALIAAPFGPEGTADNPPAYRDSSELVKVAATAQFIYDQGWLLPGPPPSPSVTALAGDHQVTLVWNNLAELAPDRYYAIAANPQSPGYDPVYKKYDFEGYKIYKSLDGSAWTVLGQCDLKDGVTFVDSVAPESLRTKATDNGLVYTWTDKNVVNGFPYYYAVTSYDYNFTTAEWDSAHTKPLRLDTLSLESGRTPLTAIPRIEAANIMPVESLAVTQILGDSTRTALKLYARIAGLPLVVAAPYEVRMDSLRCEFVTYSYKTSDTTTAVETNPLPVYHYRIVNTQTDAVAGEGDMVYNVVRTESLNTLTPVFAGMQLRTIMKLPLPARFFDSVYVAQGVYNGRLGVGSRAPDARWAYRGADFELRWKKVGGNLTLEVRDLTNDLVVPFTSYIFRTQTDTVEANIKKASGWNFVTKVLATDPDLPPSATLRATDKLLYLCGQAIKLDNLKAVGPVMGTIQDGDIWRVNGPSADVAKLAPIRVRYSFSTVDKNLRFDTTSTLRLAVRMVPNPYIVTNKWEKDLYHRKVQFTHLPAECTIRVFNMAGDLVRVINHRSTSTRTGDTTPVPDDLGGTETWDLLNSQQQAIASGVYIYHVQSAVGDCVGRFLYVH